MATAYDVCRRLQEATSAMLELTRVLASKNAYDAERAVDVAETVYGTKEQAATRLKTKHADMQADIAAVSALAKRIDGLLPEALATVGAARRTSLSASFHRDFFNIDGKEPLAAMAQETRSFHGVPIDPTASFRNGGITGMATYSFPLAAMSTPTDSGTVKMES